MSSLTQSGKVFASVGAPLLVFAITLWASLGGRPAASEAGGNDGAKRERAGVSRAPTVTETGVGGLALPGPRVVRILGREGPPVAYAPVPDGSGRSVAVACATCHTTRPADRAKNDPAALDLFHQGLRVAHGGLACAACHDAPSYDALHLADGRRVPYESAQELCGQCHGPQRRDYAHGAHGGMIGSWDLERGGRVRNGCLSCHDPHAPAYPKVQPARGPNDRFLTREGPRAGHAGSVGASSEEQP